MIATKSDSHYSKGFFGVFRSWFPSRNGLFFDTVNWAVFATSRGPYVRVKILEYFR